MAIPLAVGLGVAGATLAAKGVKHLAASRSDAGKALKQYEGEAAERLSEGGYKGLSDAQKRQMIMQSVKAQRAGEGGTAAMSEAITRTQRAQGPFGAGQVTAQRGAIAKAEGAGAAKAGGQAAQLSSQLAQQQKAADTAAVIAAYNRKLGQLQELVEDPVAAGLQAGVEQATGLTAGGENLRYEQIAVER